MNNKIFVGEDNEFYKFIVYYSYLEGGVEHTLLSDAVKDKIVNSISLKGHRPRLAGCNASNLARLGLKILWKISSLGLKEYQQEIITIPRGDQN